MSGRIVTVMVRDFGLGGAMLDQVPRDLPLNTPVTLAIEGIPADLTGSIARKDGDAVLVRFDLPNEVADVLNAAISMENAA